MDIGRHELLVRELKFPPRPEVVTILAQEGAREHPDVHRICKAVKADVAMAGAMLKAVNSPVFALSKKVTTIDGAIAVLGVKNVKSIATGLALRSSVGSGPSMERFWDSAEKVALISAHVAKVFRTTKADEAYTYGLFHNCGIPMLMQRFPNYRDALIAANKNAEVPFTTCEDDVVGTNHAVVGYFLARAWELPDATTEAILRHHESDVFDQTELAGQTHGLIAIGHMAEHIYHLMVRTSVDLEWERFGAASLAHLGFSEAEFFEIADDAQAVAKAS